MKPLWKVKGFEKQTLWKVSVLPFLPPVVVSSFLLLYLLSRSLSLSLSVSVSRCFGVVFGVWVCDTLKKNRVSIQNVPVCTFNTSPCICVSTCARGAGTHADVLNVPHHTTHTHHDHNHRHHAETETVLPFTRACFEQL